MSENEQVQEAPSAPAVQVPIEQLIQGFEAHLNVVMIGLCACHPGIDRALMWELLIHASGRAFSRQTKTPVVSETLSARDKFAKIFSDELRKFIPALDKAFNLPPHANGNALRQ